MHHLHPLPVTIDAISLATLAGWWAGVVPSIATTLTVVWVLFCFAKEFYMWKKGK